MKKYTLILAVAMAVFASCGGKTRKPEVATVPDEITAKVFEMQLSDSLIMHRRADTLDFGRVREGQVVVRDLKVRNAGDRPMVITHVDVSCGCVEAIYPKDPLKPGDSGDMTIKLDTKGLGGWAYKTVVIQTSIVSKPYLLIVIAEVE